MSHVRVRPSDGSIDEVLSPFSCLQDRGLTRPSEPATFSYQLLRGVALTKPADLVQGTLDLLILRVVALEPMHGWAIAQRIHQMSNEELRVGQSALYPALHKLEQQGWIEAEWALSENNRRAKYYKLTAAGRRALKSETAQWERLSAAISLVVKPT
jgi:PadR family transcriptional regulator, regulatory protein PadR